MNRIFLIFSVVFMAITGTKEAYAAIKKKSSAVLLSLYQQKLAPMEN